MTGIEDSDESNHASVQSAKINLAEFNRRLSRTRMEKEEKILARRLEPYVDRDPQRVLHAMYNYFDRYYQIGHDLVACQDKCSFCCMIPAVISSIEADIISIKIRVPIKQGARHHIPPAAFISPCPFLKDRSCSVYDVRPMVCRTHHNYSTNNNACLPGSAEPQLHADRRRTFPHLMRLYDQIRAKAPSGDIRSFF